MFSCWGVPCRTWHPKDAGISPPMPSLAWFEAALPPSRMHCASGLPKVHRNGSVTYDHQMLGAAIVHPDVWAVLPCMPAPPFQHDRTGQGQSKKAASGPSHFTMHVFRSVKALPYGKPRNRSTCARG